MESEARGFKWVGTRPIRPDGVEKVTGRAMFGADLNLPGMLVGKVLRSPHSHARIVAIDARKALALPGVKAVITSADLPELASKWVGDYRIEKNPRHTSHNILARGKVLYDGHAVAAVAATSAAIATEAVSLIDVDYEVLPHVMDVLEAMEPDAPLLHDDLITRGVSPPPDRPSNIAKRHEFSLGDVAAGFEQAELVVERRFTTRPVHQGYIEPHAVVADTSEDGKTEIWCSSQGHFQVRATCASVLGIDVSRIKVTPAEIGGGFGGKTIIYLEPLAALLSHKTGRPVKMVMSREEVFRGTGPAPGSVSTVKIGTTRDGRITAAEATLIYQAGAFPGSPVINGCMCAFGPYQIENVKVVGYDVVVNRPKAAAYRAPGAPLSVFAVESVMDEIAKRLGIDPLDLREKNAAQEGTQAAYGPRFGPIGFRETLRAARATAHYSTPLGPNQGRGIASGFWFNGAGQSSATVNLNEDGSAIVVTGSPDIGGSRASMAIMAAEVLGIDVAKVRSIVGDTDAIGFTNPTSGSRVTFATGMAVVEAAQDAVARLCARAARIWEVDADQVVWEDGHARPASSNVGDFEPLSLAELAATAAKTGGPIAGHCSLTAQGQGPGFGTQICDVELDPETGRVTVLRYTAVQDVGRAIHPSYVEGQMQGGVAQGIGWALNEEYVYGADGRLQNPGFLDYRIPVTSDLPMIDTVMVEVPNPRHPFGARGVGEVPIVPAMAAVANAIDSAIGVRLTDLPMSPPRVLAAIDRAA